MAHGVMFRVVRDLNSMSSPIRQKVVDLTKKYLGVHNAFEWLPLRDVKAIVKEDTLVGLCVSNRHELKGDRTVYLIWGPPSKELLEFGEKYGVTPAEYLYDELVREGTAKIHYLSTTEEGKAFLEKLRKRGLIKAAHSANLKKQETVTPAWKEIAKKRPRIL